MRSYLLSRFIQNCENGSLQSGSRCTAGLAEQQAPQLMRRRAPGDVSSKPGVDMCLFGFLMSL